MMVDPYARLNEAHREAMGTPWSSRRQLSDRFWIEHDARLAREARVADGAFLVYALILAGLSLALLGCAWWFWL
ncbi:MAG: hypothetical protein M3Q08_01055 [Pseudomonadota bacterium]|nr:hypothetical protein [Pseudomonadota bacterium]